MRYINELHEGENVTEHYLCKKKQMLKSRSGKTYLSLVLQDKTGTIDSKVWDLNNNIQNFEENDFIKIDAVVLTYQNDLQLTIRKIRRSVEGEYNPADYIPTTSENINELYKNITDYIDSIKNNYLKQLLENILIKNTEINECFKAHSAAKAMHHSYMGGLIEHTHSVAQLCDFMASKYKFANRDLLITAALLHDIGKIYELSPFPINDYTDSGQLLGHIVIGVELINSESQKIEAFPEELLKLLKHCILSHHGQLEYGSPKLPSIIEAFMLSYADDMDAKIKIFEEALKNGGGKWTGYNRILLRNIRKTDYNE